METGKVNLISGASYPSVTWLSPLLFCSKTLSVVSICS